MNDRLEIETQKFMQECFEYKNGRIYWKRRPLHHFLDEWRQKIFIARFEGHEAGTLSSGYRMVNFCRGRMGVHRIIFLLHHGYLPQEVDHINGDPLDNRIENLRAATHAQNLKNMRTPRTNTSGRKGVYWHKKSNKWRAGIRADGKWLHLGCFDEASDAIEARAKAESEHYREFSNGR